MRLSTGRRAREARLDRMLTEDDPTELKALADQFAESRREFNSVLRSLSGLFYRCELNAPWQITFVSEGVQTLTGYDAQEILWQNGWLNLMWVEDRAAVAEAVAEAVAAKSTFDLAYRITRKSGEMRWVNERGHCIYDAEGTPRFLEGVICDISGRKADEELQKTALERWRRTLDAIPQMVWTMGADGSDEFYNAQWVRFTGCHVGGKGEPSRSDLVHIDDRQRVMALWKEKLEKADRYEAQYRLKHATGDYRWVLSRGEPEKDSSGKALCWYGTCTDIHDEVLGREALQSSEALNRSMIEGSPDCISLLDATGHTRYLNRAASQAIGVTKADALLGRPWTAAFPPSLRRTAATAVSQAAGGRTGHFTARQTHGEGERWWDVVVAPITDDEGALTGLISIARDITHQKTAEERIRWAASHDPLTQLPNRAMFQRTLDRTLAEARADGGEFTVLMMDLDNFKRTNDALGHDGGDFLLTEFATRLRDAVRADDLVARLGGDEFAVLLRGVGQREELQAAVDSMMTGLKAPCHFEGKLLDIRTSIGASTFPRDGNTRAELLKHADMALYGAKSAGRGVLRAFPAGDASRGSKATVNAGGSA